MIMDLVYAPFCLVRQPRLGMSFWYFLPKCLIVFCFSYRATQSMEAANPPPMMEHHAVSLHRIWRIRSPKAWRYALVMTPPPPL